MSCDRRCFDPKDKHYAHDDCSTCPGADRGPGVGTRFAFMAAAKVEGERMRSTYPNQQNLPVKDRRYPLVEACSNCWRLGGDHAPGCPEAP